LRIEPDKNYVLLLFRSKPTLVLPKYIFALKTLTSREIRRNFLEVKIKLWKKMFWARSSFLATTGKIPLDVLKQYFESQGVKDA